MMCLLRDVGGGSFDMLNCFCGLMLCLLCSFAFLNLCMFVYVNVFLMFDVVFVAFSLFYVYNVLSVGKTVVCCVCV